MDTAPDQNAAQDSTPPAPVMESAPADAQKSPAYGSLLGIILIVAVLVVGAFYVWGERLKTDQQQVPEGGVRGDTLPLEGDASADVEAEGVVPQPR